MAHPATHSAPAPPSVDASHEGDSASASEPGLSGVPTTATTVALNATVVVVGASGLGIEIAAARLLAPYFGASTVVWASTIGTVLLSLSIGYWVGGKWADRHPRLSAMSKIVLSAAILLAAVPFGADPFLSLSVRALGALSLGGLVGSLAGVLTLVALPLVLLGAIAPYANRLALYDIGTAGRTTGHLYALSTAGALAGTFLSALVLIPFFGTHRAFITFALILAMVAAPWAGSRLFLLAPLVVSALLLVPPTAPFATTTGAHVIRSVETEYQNARILEQPSGERWLQVNEPIAVQSIYRPWSFLTGGFMDDFLVLPFAGGRDTAPDRIAILGNAAGSIARAYGHYFPGTRVDAVEIDGALTSIGVHYFGLRGPRLHVYTADARPWLAASTARYGAIFLDAYRMPYIPFYLATHEFFDSVKRHLQPGGVLVINVGYPPEQGRPLTDVVASTVRSVFPAVEREVADPANTLVVASMQKISSKQMLEARLSLPRELRPLATAVSSRLTAAPVAGPVYTDDLAPIEWLTNLSSLRYAGL